MNEPTRWRDDPEFLAETGIDLSAEQESLSQYNLPELHKSLGVAIAGNALPAVQLAQTGATFGVKALLVSAAVGAASYAGVEKAIEVVREEPPPAVEQPVVVPAPEPIPEPPPAAVAPPPKPEPPRARKPKPPAEEPAVGTLAHELRLFERGEEARKAGRHGVAIRELRRYLELYPRGELWREAELSLAQSLLGAGQHQEAATRARKLLADPATTQNTLVYGILGEALAAAGDCEGARPALRQAGFTAAQIAELCP